MLSVSLLENHVVDLEGEVEGEEEDNDKNEDGDADDAGSLVVVHLACSQLQQSIRAQTLLGQEMANLGWA